MMILVLLAIVIIYECAITGFELNHDFITPKYIYQNTECNKPTCWILFILLRLTSLFCTCLYIGWLIIKAVIWLATVGRKEE